MRRSGIAAGVVIGSALLASLFVWGCGCAGKRAAPGRSPDGGGAPGEDGPADTLFQIEAQNFERRPEPAETPARRDGIPREVEETLGRAVTMLPAEEGRGNEGDRPATAGRKPAGEKPDDLRAETARKLDEAKKEFERKLKDHGIPVGDEGKEPAAEPAPKWLDTRVKTKPPEAPPKDPGTAVARVGPAAPAKEQRDLTEEGRRLARENTVKALESELRALRKEETAPIKSRAPRRSWQTDLATDELWVIERPGAGSNQPAAKDDDAPTQGELRAKVKDANGIEAEVPLPLEHTDVKASVAAFVATVDVTQKYRNPYDTKIEAVYVFPLPENAAVTDFIMTIGDRRIRGLIREREEARKIYEEAKRQGYAASLLTQERPNVFTQRVANIEPLKSIGITIRYFNTLEYSRGEYEFIFPMVVGPRYNPAGSRDGVGAVARGRAGSSGQPVEVKYLKPGERSGHDISLTLDVDAGVEIEDVKCPSHAVDTQRPSPSRVRVALSDLDSIPNKDFVLRYKVAGKRMKTAFLTHTGEKGSHFALVLQPPEELADLPRMPREMVFVLDCSGSMSGWPIQKAKEAMRRCLTKLASDDTFQVIRFSNRASALGNAPLPATPANVRRGLEYVDGLSGSGGTEMVEGIRAALDFPHDAKRLRIVSFMTDGFIGNESQILAAVHEKLGSARIFSFGVGNSVNRYLLDGMARMGKGAVAYVGLQEGATEAVDMFYDRSSRPAMTDIAIDWGAMKVDSVYPRNVPDLFVGRPVVITGRYEGSGSNSIRVSGRSGPNDHAFTMDVDLDAPEAQHVGIAKVWARKKLAELAAHMTYEPSDELKGEMTALSLEYSVQCRWTAFLAVDSSRVTEGATGVTVAVPVPVPDGVKYETTVGE